MTDTTTTQHIAGDHRVVLHDVCTGRKGPAYDWHAVLIPSDTVFEASLQMMLAAPAVAGRTRKSRRRS
jgi:hypothetical protein